MTLRSWFRSASRPLSSAERPNREAGRRTLRLEALEERALLSVTNFDGEFRGSALPDDNQERPAVASDAAGNFVMVWEVDGGQDGDGEGILGQRFNAAGQRVGPEFQANTFTTGNQIEPAVAMAAGGSFVVAWQSFAQDGSGFGVFAQLFNAAGAPVGGEIAVNTTTTDNQQYASVAMDAGGNFVIAWESFGQDGDGFGIFARRFNAASAPLSGEFLVNTETDNDQGGASVARQPGGEFIIAWSSFGQDGSMGGIYAQRFTAAGGLVGQELPVNTTTNGNQQAPSVAVDADGDFIIAWESDGQDGDGFGIFAQRFTAAGQMQGQEFLVNTTTINNQRQPAAAMDAQGNFAIAWQSFAQDGDGQGIYFKTYNEAGAAQAGEQRANDVTTGNQARPSVAMDPDGDFLIAWESFGQDGDGYGVYAQQYRQVGNELTALVGEFRVNTTTTNNQQEPAVAADAQGNYVVVWESFNQIAAGWDIYAQRYNAAGQPQGLEFRVNTTTTLDQRHPAVAMDLSGGFVVAWQDITSTMTGASTIRAQRFSSGGVFLGSELLASQIHQGAVTTSLTVNAFPAVAIDADGDFAIAWQGGLIANPNRTIYANRFNTAGIQQGDTLVVSSGVADTDATADMDSSGRLVIAWQRFGPSLNDVYARVYSASGTPLTSEFVVSQITGDQQRSPAVAMDADGDFVVAWMNFDLTNFPDRLYDIMARRFNASGVPQGDEFLATSTTSSDQNDPDVDMDAQGNFLIAWWSFSVPSDEIFARRFSADGEPTSIEFRVNGGTANNRSAPAVGLDAEGDAVIVWESDGQDGSLNEVYAQRYSLHVPVAGSAFAVNTETIDTQALPAVAMDADGDYVVVWESNEQDGDMWGVFGQRFDKSGRPLGDEFLVNTETDFSQQHAAVARDADGDFVVVWQSFAQDGDGFGIYGQRFTAAGQPLGNEFRVNTTTQNNQTFPHVAMNAAGSFVVVWQHDDNADTEIFAQRYDANGMPQGNEFRVNTFTTNDQTRPEVAIDDMGNFVVVWESFAQDGSAYGIYGQRFTAAGQPLGGEFRINTVADLSQQLPTVAMSASGAFVVAWTGNDAFESGVFAQRYSAQGVPQGGEFRVNTFTDFVQHDAAAAMDDRGNFVIAWRSALQDGSLRGTHAQRYDATGTPVGQEFRVNFFTTGQQGFPAAAMDADGDFVVAWEGNGPADDQGINAQRFDVPLAPRIVVAPDTGNEGRVRVLDAQTGVEQFNFLPYGAFMGGVRVATGDVTGDGTPDIITAAGPNGGPHVRVFDGVTGAQVPGAIGSFFAYSAAFNGGVFVAAGDVNGDGLADVITGADAGGGPHVRIFSGATGGELFGFFAYSSLFGGGVRVAAGDVDGDGRADIVTTPGAGGGPHVRVFSGATSAELFGFFAYNPNFGGGVFVATGDVNGDGRADIITGAGANGGPHVRVFSGAGGQQLPGTIGSFYAYAPDMTRGVRVASVDANGDGKSDILAATGPFGTFEVRLFDAVAGPQQSNFSVPGIPTGGAFVAGAHQQSQPPAPLSFAPLLAARGLAVVASTPAATTVNQHSLVSAALEPWTSDDEDHDSDPLELEADLHQSLTPEILAAALAGLTSDL